MHETVTTFREAERPDQDAAALDIIFHEIIVALPGNRPLLTAWQLFAGLFYAMLFVTNSATQDFQRIGTEHSRIYRCIEKGEPTKGIPVLTEHLETAKRLLVDRLEELQAKNAQ